MTSLEDCFPGVWMCVCTHATEHAVLRFDVFGCLSSTTTLYWGMNWYNWAYRIFLAFFHHTDQFDWGTTTHKRVCWIYYTMWDWKQAGEGPVCWREVQMSPKKRWELLWSDCKTAQKIHITMALHLSVLSSFGFHLFFKEKKSRLLAFDCN